MEKSPIIEMDDKSKIVLISDCHRGDGSFKDNFLPNSNIYITALNYYYTNGFNYIEIGDGDELWEVRKIQDIYDIYKDIFEMLLKFKESNRLYMIYGNHDEVKKRTSFRKKLCKKSHENEEENCLCKLYSNLDVYEGLILRYNNHNTNNKKLDFLVTHGNQLDFINYNLSFITKYVVRYIWGFLEANFGFRNNTSPAKSNTKRDKIDRKIERWAKENNQPIITGHTHGSKFPTPSKTPYFNDGCCVLPYSISTIEIENGEIALIKWSVKVMKDGVLVVKREIIGGPERIESYGNKIKTRQ